jgi:serine/threonine protein phosphatase 1
MAKYIIADIHGCHKELLQCIERSGFNPQEDTLISLGDLVDRGPASFQVVEYIKNLPNKICIRGNHDVWWYEFLKTGLHPCDFHHGARETYISYEAMEEEMQEKLQSHREFFGSQIDYYLDNDGNLFVHGGINRHQLLDKQSDSVVYYWDRDMFMQALSAGILVNGNIPNSKQSITFKDDRIKRVFIGHTPTINFKVEGNDLPLFASNGKVINLDTGCCFGNKLTIMNLDTLEYWQSDLYKN